METKKKSQSGEYNVLSYNTDLLQINIFTGT